MICGTRIKLTNEHQEKNDVKYEIKEMGIIKKTNLQSKNKNYFLLHCLIISYLCIIVKKKHTNIQILKY